MRTRVRTMAFASVLLLIAAAAVAQQSPVTLQIRGTQGRTMKYDADIGMTLGFDFVGLPFPGSKMSGENISAAAEMDAYFDTEDVSETGTIFNVRGMLKNIILGGLMQLPDLGGIGGIGEGKSAGITLDVAPNGSINNIEIGSFKMPGGLNDMLKGSIPGLDSLGIDISSLDTILPIITGLIPPMFPDNPVGVGDTWTEKISQDDMPMPIFPILEFNYKLVSLENGVAHIEYTSEGDYDADFLNSFLSMVPEIPMGADEMTIDEVDLKVKWDISGTLDMQTEKNMIQAMVSKSRVAVKGGAKVSFKHPDGKTEVWVPDLKMTVNLSGGMKYAGDVTREELDTLFPPPAEEEEEGAPEEGGKKGEL